MAQPYTRAKKYGGGGGGAELLAQLFGALGGGEVEAEGANEGEFDAGDKKVVKYKPKHPVLNVFSGGQGSIAANAANLGEAEAGQEQQRRFGLIDKASSSAVDRQGKLDKLALDHAYRKMYTDETGEMPVDGDINWEKWRQGRYNSAIAEQGASTARSIFAKGAATRGEDIADATHGFNKGTALNTAEAGSNRAVGDVVTSKHELASLPEDLKFAEVVKRGQQQDYPANRRALNARNAQAITPFGAYNYDTGALREFPIRQTPMQELTTGIAQDALGGGTNVKPRIGDGTVYDTKTGTRFYPNPAKGGASGTNGISAKPGAASLAPANSLQPVPVRGIGQDTGFGMDQSEMLRAVLSRMIPKESGYLQYPSVPGTAGNFRAGGNLYEGDLDTLSEEELQDIYNRLKGR